MELYSVFVGYPIPSSWCFFRELFSSNFFLTTYTSLHNVWKDNVQIPLVENMGENKQAKQTFEVRWVI